LLPELLLPKLLLPAALLAALGLAGARWSTATRLATEPGPAWPLATLGPATLGPATLGPATLGPATLGPASGADPFAMSRGQPLLSRAWAWDPERALDAQSVEAFAGTGGLPRRLVVRVAQDLAVEPDVAALVLVPGALARVQAACPAVSDHVAALCQAETVARLEAQVPASLAAAVQDTSLAEPAAALACSRAPAPVASALRALPSPSPQDQALALFLDGCASGRPDAARAALASPPPLRWMALLELARLPGGRSELASVAAGEPATVAGALARYGLAGSTESSTTAVPSVP